MTETVSHIPSAMAAASTLIVLLLASTLLTFWATQISYFKSSQPSTQEPSPNATLKFRLTFSWYDCSTHSNPLGTIQSFNVAPDPLIIPGDVSLEMVGSLNRQITKRTPFRTKVEKRLGPVWVPIPCESGFGSCDYEDFCLNWPIPGPECPLPYQKHGIPCECPFSAKNYTLPLSNIGHIDAAKIPGWLENGVYSIKVSLADDESDDALCIQMIVKVHPL